MEKVLLVRNGVEKLWNESDKEMLKSRGWVEVAPAVQESPAKYGKKKAGKDGQE